jgi:hypothetical protein
MGHQVVLEKVEQREEETVEVMVVEILEVFKYIREIYINWMKKFKTHGMPPNGGKNGGLKQINI